MFNQYFGNYLLNKSLITREQLKEALDYQKSTHLKMGILAVNAGYMTVKQITEIHQLQKKVDKKFGELAIQQGYLNNEKIEELLSTQKQGHLLLGQALIDKNYMSIEKFKEALDDYKQDYGFSEEEFEALQQDNIEEFVKSFIEFGDNTNHQIYQDYISLFIRNLIRFADYSSRIERNAVSEECSTDWIVGQQITGQFDLFTAIAADEEVFLELAGRYAGEYFDKPNELALASFSEFLNLHNGIFLVNMSNQGIDLRMEAQSTDGRQMLSDLKQKYVITIYLSSGKVNLILSK